MSDPDDLTPSDPSDTGTDSPAPSEDDGGDTAPVYISTPVTPPTDPDDGSGGIPNPGGIDL